MWCLARARSAMSALSALEKRLTALVPPTTEASAPPDQRSLFELLAETAATTLRSSSGEVKEAQRPLEDALLRVTCGGWAGPAVRVTAANVLANLFFVGNEVALYSCVNELVAVAFAEDDKKAPSLVSRRDRAGETAGTPPLVAGASLRAAKRIGALDALTRLANKGHAESMRGAAGGVVAAAEKLLRRAPERAASADGSAKGARAVRRAALRTVGAIVSSTAGSKGFPSSPSSADDRKRNRSRPLRPETRAAAAELLLAAIAFDAPARTADGSSAAAPHALGADAGAVAAACAALGALATSPGGFDLWTDPASGENGAKTFSSLGDAAAASLFSLLDHDDDDAAAAAAAALGKLAAARLKIKTPEERRAEAARQTSAAPRDGGRGASSSGDAGMTKTTTFGASFFGARRSEKNASEKNAIKKNAAEAKAEAELAAATHAARALDLERPGGMALWHDTNRACFSVPIARRALRDADFENVSGKRRARRRALNFGHQLTHRRRRFNAGIAQAWTVFTFEASRCASAETPLPKHAMVDLAEAALCAFAPLSETGSARLSENSAHARSCAVHVVRHGALAHLDESGRRALVERLTELLAPGGSNAGPAGNPGAAGDDEDGGFDDDATRHVGASDASRHVDARPPSASALLLCSVAALEASGRVDGELFDTARSALFLSEKALERPHDAARALCALAAAAPERAAALLRDATARMRACAAQSDKSADLSDHASARLGARVAAALVAEADAFELGLPVKDVSDAARAAFALAVAFEKPGSSDASYAFPRGDERADWLITRAFAWEATASALVFFSANGSRTGTRSEASERVRKLPNAALPASRSLDVAAVRDALARALDPSGLIAAVAETDAEQTAEAASEAAPEAAARAVSTSAASFRLGSSLSMFSPVKKKAETTTTRDPPEVAGSSSYGSAAARDSPASSLPGSPSRPKEPNKSGGSRGHSRSHSFSSLNSSSKSRTSSWAPAAESRLRAAAADAVAPFALFARSERADDELARRDARPLLRDALSCACHPAPVSKNAWPADPETASAAAILRLRALEAFVSAPSFVFSQTNDASDDGDTSSHRLSAVFDAAVAACAALPDSAPPRRVAAEDDTAPSAASSSPDVFLRRALNPADAPLGPWHGEGSDAAGGSLRRLEGAADDSAVPSPWRERHARSELSLEEWEESAEHSSLGASLRVARARALARVAAESPARAAAVLAATALEAVAAASGEDGESGARFARGGAFLTPHASADDLLSAGTSVPAENGVGASSPPTSPARLANGGHRRGRSVGGGSGSLFALTLSTSKTDQKKALREKVSEAERASASLTSACVTSLAVAEAMASSFEKRRSSVVVASFRKDGASAARDAEFSSSSSATLGEEETLEEKNREGLKFPGTFPSRRETAASLVGVAEAVSRSRFAGAAHWRAAAELEAIAASIRDDAAAAADALRERAAEIANLPVTYYKNDKNDENKSEAPHHRTHRAAACAACASSFRRAGALAMAAATRPLASALASAAAQLDGTPRASDATHLWAAHALGVVAAHAGPAFERRAPATLDLVFALLNSPEANDVVVEHLSDHPNDDHPSVAESERTICYQSRNASRAASSLRAACGRLVNAATAAVGPELDAISRDVNSGLPMSKASSLTTKSSAQLPSFFAFASALMDAVSDGGEGGGAPAGAYGNLVSAFGGDARDAGDVFSFLDGEKNGDQHFAPLTFRETNGDDDGAFDVRLTDAGDGACRHEAATYVQQLAIFAPRVATPARLVPRLRASLFSARPALRRAAAQTLKHLCERDAGAVARAAAVDGGGLEGDLLRFVDRFENGDLVAATHARRAARLLTGHASRFGDGPASAMRALAAVALWTPGGGATPTSDETSSGFAESGTRGFFRSAPKLTTRVLAAALIAEAPTAFSEKNKTETFSVADARAAVDCAYRLATAPAAALRPAGLRALRLTLASLRGREDPDANTVGNGRSETILFAAQFQAQTLSALRAAREPDAPPRCFAEGARLAATATACGLDAGDPRAARAIRAFVREPLEAWLGEKETKNAKTSDATDATDATDASDRSDDSDDSVEQTLVTTSSPLTRRASASCAEGIVVRLRVAALASSARLYLLESAEGDGAVGVNPPRAFSRLALKWAAVASDFAAALVDGSRVAASFPLSVVPASLRGTSAVAEDLADAWGPCLDAATRALFAHKGMGADAEDADARAREDSDETPPREPQEPLVPYRAARAFALLASALAEAQLRGSLELYFVDDANGPDAPLAKPLNPSAKRRDDRGANGRTPLVGSDVADARSGSAFAVARGRPSDARAALAARCLARIANWTFRPETDIMEKDITLRRSVASACASAARALDAGVDSDAEDAEDAEDAGTEKFREKFRDFRGVSFAAEARALGSVLAAHAAHADAAAAAVAVAAGLARRPGFACAARAAEIVAAVSACTDAGAAGGANALLRASQKKTKIVTPLLLLTAVRTLLESSVLTASVTGESVTRESVTRERAENASRPFAFAFASLAASADAATAAMAKRALFGDAFETLEFGNDDAIAALAAASVFECAVSRNDTDRQKTEDGVPVALRALAAFFSDAAAPRRAAPRETAAFAALREAISRNGIFGIGRSPCCATFLRALGPACASATLRRARLCAAPNRSHAARRADVVAAAEGLKFWAAATSALALESDDAAAVVARQKATVAAFLPLALEAIAPTRIVVTRDGSDGGGDSLRGFETLETLETLETEEEAGSPHEEREEGERAALAAAATRLVASLAGTAPAAFRAAVAALRPESTARLRAAMGGRDKGKLPSVGARAQGEPHQSQASMPPPPSFAAFENA